MLHHRILLLSTVIAATSATTGCSFQGSVPVASTLSSSHASTLPDGQATGGPATHPVDKGGAATSGTFRGMDPLTNAHLQWFNKSSGYAWGYRQSEFTIYHTSNSGSTWQELTIPNLPKDRVSSRGPNGLNYVLPSFFDDAHGQVLWLTPGQAHLLSTTDGGISWQETKVSVPSDVVRVGQTSFSSLKNGWLLLLGGGSSGSSSKYLYHTVDGGLSWKLVNSSMNALPHNGTDVSIDFSTDGKHGVLTAIDPLNTSIGVETTADAGLHWSPQPIALPPAAQKVSVIPSARPHAFSNMQARITAVVQTVSGNRLIVFREKSKGGWQSLVTPVGDVQAVGWNSANSGMLLEQQDGKENLLRTLDGGATWVTDGSLPDSLMDVKYTVTEFQLVDPATGWLVLQNSQLQSTLLTSTDGGRHWTKS